MRFLSLRTGSLARRGTRGWGRRGKRALLPREPVRRLAVSSRIRVSSFPTCFSFFTYLVCLSFFAVQLVRSSLAEDGKHDRLLEEKTDRNKLSAIFDSLNFLGACAWRINHRILDLAIRVFNEGGRDELAVPGPMVPCTSEHAERLVEVQHALSAHTLISG